MALLPLKALQTQNLKFFDKKGFNLNPSLTLAIGVNILSPVEGGYGANVIAYTDPSKKIVKVDIIDSGLGYAQGSFLQFVDINTGHIWDTDPVNLTIGSNGELIAFTITPSDENKDFSYPASYLFMNQYLEPVSTGLIATDHIFMLEEVYDTVNNKTELAYPRTSEYGTFFGNEISGNGSSASISIKNYTFTGTVNSPYNNYVHGINPVDLANLEVGMYLIGNSIPALTTIEEVNTDYNYIVISNSAVLTGSLTFSAYAAHNLREGNVINIHNCSSVPGLIGEREITKVELTKIHFDYDKSFNTVTSTNCIEWGVVPVYRISFTLGSDDEFFLFDVTYNEDYPTISKSKEIYFNLQNGWDFPSVNDWDNFDTNSPRFIRRVNDDLTKKLLQFNVGLQAEAEGVYSAELRIEDVTYSEPTPVFSGLYEGFVIAEEERFESMLQNFGRDVDRTEELIMRDSDVNEDFPDYRLLNAKRREMLLEGDNIWPYMGSYKGLVNIVNWFGYYDVRIKEYWLNVNSEDEYYGKYKQIQIPFQLKNKGQSGESISLLPSTSYKKSNLFGLFYDIVRNDGTFDENGTPLTEDAFDYTNEEVLIKLFALKKYLKEKFLPLNTKIIDITGEGVYYERYSLNSWNDVNNRYDINLTRSIDFKANTVKPQIKDIRPFSANESLKSPAFTDELQKYLNKYNFRKVLITNPGGPYFGTVPKISFPGSAVTQAVAAVRMKGQVSTITFSTVTGNDYAIGDIITLSGGTYENPIRLVVSNVNGSGGIVDADIIVGPNQGSNYSAMPTQFGQSSVIRIVGGNKTTPPVSGFYCVAADIPFECESVYMYTYGVNYNTIPFAQFTPNAGSTSAEIPFETSGNVPNIYYNNGETITTFDDAPGIPVAAPVNLKTSFDITWDEVPYTWDQLGGSNDSLLKAWSDGTLVAVEIVAAGDGYTTTPSVLISEGDGFGGTASASLLNGKIKILEYVVSTVTSGAGTNDVITLTPALPASGILSVSTNKIIKSTGGKIPDGTIINAINQPISELTLESYDGSNVTTTLAPGDVLYIHQGINVTAGGTYSDTPNVTTTGGKGFSFTWDKLGQGDMYQMEWRVKLETPENPSHIFNYRTGVKPIDELLTHDVYLPYEGGYTIELVVYDTDNNFINEIKNNYVVASLPEATFAYATRYISDCADTWDEFYQEPIPEFEPSAQMLNPPPFEGIRYTWENAGGRWVNPIFNPSTWEDSTITWKTLELGNFSLLNNYKLPTPKPVDVIQVSAEDNLEGYVISYTDNTTTPSSINPTITVFGQRTLPEIDTPINPNDWIYIRRGANIYQLQVLSANYAIPNRTVIELVKKPPLAFRQGPKTWQVLREIGGTVILKGNQIYNELTNPNGIRIGEYIRLVGEDNVPKRERVGIKSRTADAIVLEDSTNSIYNEGGEISKIYKFRGSNAANGNLVWDSNNSTTWVIDTSGSIDPAVNDHIAKLYIVSANAGSGVPGCLPANPTGEIEAGFSIGIIKVKDVLGNIIYEQRLRINKVFFDTGNSGNPYNLWAGAGLTGFTGIHVLDVVALDGGNLRGLNAYLTNQKTAGSDIWLEYEYNVFTARTYKGINSGGDAKIFMDYNMYPAINSFANAGANEFPASNVNNTGWYYDHGIVTGDWSLYVTNTGSWRNGLGTVITVDDSNSELFRSSSSFTAYQQNFDSDAAELNLGTLVRTWSNSKNITWDESCYHSYDTSDMQSGYGCNFRISQIAPNGKIKMNTDPTFSFVTVLNSQNTAQKWSRAITELNFTDNSALSRYDYQLGSNSHLKLVTGTVNTYVSPNKIFGLSHGGTAPIVNDVLFNDYIGPGLKITTIAGSDYTLSGNINKLGVFTGDVTSGSYFIKNIKGLLESQVYVGQVITGTGLNSNPSPASKVIEIYAVEGQVRELKLSEASNVTSDIQTYTIEFVADTPIMFNHLINTAGVFYIDAYAKTPSMDHLGWLIGQSGVRFYDFYRKLPTTLCHSYPLRNILGAFGYGTGLVGAFEGGLNEFLMNERAYQVFYTEGINPSGGKGWYPADLLEPAYSFIGNSSSLPLQPFDNENEARTQSNRLPYETGIGGSWRWEDTYMGTKPTKVPKGSSVLFTSDASKIAGKTRFMWKLKENDNTILEIEDNAFMWNFNKNGKFTVELEITDTNGNTKNLEKKDFIEVYAD